MCCGLCGAWGGGDKGHTEGIIRLGALVTTGDEVGTAGTAVGGVVAGRGAVVGGASVEGAEGATVGAAVEGAVV